MLVEFLKSKIHQVTVTQANVNYIGSITIDETLMEAANILEGQKVQVVNINNGERLETYVITAPAGSGQIVINGAAAHRIGKGEMVTIMAFGQSQVPIMPKRLLMNERNEIVNTSVL